MESINYRVLAIPEDLSPAIPPSQWPWFFMLFVAYFVTAYAGSFLYNTVHTFPGVIWPAAAVAMGGLVIGGRRLWPAVFFAAFLATLLSGISFLPTIILAAGHTLQAIAGAWLLRKLKFNTLLARLSDAISFSMTALVATTVVPTISTFVRIYFLGIDQLTNFWSVWGPLWVGQMFSIIVFMPFIVRWLSRLHFERTLREAVEIILALVSLALIDFVLFWTHYTSVAGVSLVYVLLIPFFWIALRIGPRFMTVAIFLNAVIEIAAVLSRSPIVGASVGVTLYQTETFAIIISFIFLVIVAVVEERKDTNKELVLEVQKLERALIRIHDQEESKNRFIAVLAHELRNPLAPIVSSIELIQAESVNEGTERWIEIISDHTKIIRRLLDDLLDVSRISQNKLRLEKEEVEIGAIMQLALESASPLIASKRHTLRFEGYPGTLTVNGDAVRLQQIIVNLLNNAARYSEPGGVITVSVTATGSEVVISVKDTGIGIAPHIIGRIFEPFVQAGTQKQSAAGLGIGLSLTKQLVDLHGGIIEAKSAGLGEGSEFIVHLPLGRKVKNPLPESSHKKYPMLFKSPQIYRILVVDDNEAAAVALGRLLEYRGHKVSLAHQGTRVLAEVVRNEPEVIILDIGLPDIDGYELARRIRNEIDSKPLLIALTGYGQHEDKEHARAAGFDYHLTKPVGLDDIEAILSRISRS